MKGIKKAGFDAAGSPPDFSGAFPVACSFSGAGIIPIGSRCGAGIIPMEIGFGAGIIPIGSCFGGWDHLLHREPHRGGDRHSIARA